MTGFALAIAVPDQAAIAAAEAAAAAKREAEKQEARTNIINNLKSAKELSVESFTKAEIPGITPSNIAAVQAELLALPETSRTDIKLVLKVARKYEVVGKIGSSQVKNVQSKSLIEIGLISAANKNKETIMSAVRRASENDRDSYPEIQAIIAAEESAIQARKERTAAVIAKIKNRSKS